MLTSTWNISILPAPLLPLGAAFGVLKIAVSPVATVHKAALRAALNVIDQSLQIIVTQRRGLEKNDSLSE